MNSLTLISKFLTKKLISTKKINPLKDMVNNPENYILTAQFDVNGELNINIKKKEVTK